MPSYSRTDVVLIRYPFSDLSGAKIRPAVVINAAHISQDLIIAPLTSRIGGLLDGEFTLSAWEEAGLNVPSAIKRGIYTVESRLCLKRVGQLAEPDQKTLDASLKRWLGLQND
jgi:mRNA interferase MazF